VDIIVSGVHLAAPRSKVELMAKKQLLNARRGIAPNTPLDAGLKRTYDDFQVRLTARAVAN
jgi:hypothetical protein